MEISRREKVLMLIIMFLLLSNIFCIYIRESNNRTAITPEAIDSMFVEEEQEDKSIVVHVTGQVANKGIVTLEEGSRVIDAVQAAGGSSEEADLDKINLARIVADGEKIYVPAVGEEVDNQMLQEYGLARDGKININTAGISELENLQGIGPVLAQRIVEYRQEKGVFKTPEEIMKVSGIGPKIYEGLKDSIAIK